MCKLAWYDLDLIVNELWIVEGPEGYDINSIDPHNLPDGFRWISEAEFNNKAENREILK